MEFSGRELNLTVTDSIRFSAPFSDAVSNFLCGFPPDNFYDTVSPPIWALFWGSF